jgi:hypothetical protein
VTDTESTLQPTAQRRSLGRRRWAALAGLGFAPLIAFDLARLLEDPLEPTWVILAGAAALGSYGLLGGAAVPGPGCRCRPWPCSAWAPPPRPPWWSPRSWGLSGGRRPPRPCRLGRRPPSCQSVVVRSLAQFCLALDTTPAMTIVTVTVT